jgi:hypothetical protein
VQIGGTERRSLETGLFRWVSRAQGFTALHWAAANGHADTVAALVELGLAADTHVPRRSYTPLQVCV